MKTFGAFNEDGFKGSIEFPRFLRDMNNDVVEAMASIIGNDPVFIKGGAITEGGGNTTIADGILMVNGKLYSFSGGTYSGAPIALSVILVENTASGYPDPFFVGDSQPKKIYLSRTAAVGIPGDGDVSVGLGAVGNIKDLQVIKDEISVIPTKADKNGYDEVDPAGLTFTACQLPGNNPVFAKIRSHQSGLVSVDIRLQVTANKNWSSSSDNWIVRGLPKMLAFGGFRLIPVSIFHSIDGWNVNDRFAHLELHTQDNDANKSQLSIAKNVNIVTGNVIYVSVIYAKG